MQPIPQPLRPQPPISIGRPVGPGIPFTPPNLRPRPPISIGGPGGGIDDGGGGVGTGLPIDAPIQGPIRPPQLEQIGSIQQLIPERLGSGPGGNDADRFRRPLPPLRRRGDGFEPEPVIPIDPITGLADLTAGEPRTEVTDTLARPIPGQIPFLRDDLVFAGGSPTFDERGGILPPEDFDVGFKADRPDPRDFAKQLPGGGTIYDQLADQGEPIPQGPGVAPPGGITNPFVPPLQPPPVPLSERTDIFGAGKRFDPANLPEGFSFQDTSGMMRTTVMPRPGFVYAYGPDGQRVEVPSGEPGAAELRDRPNPFDAINAGTNITPPPVPDPVPDPIPQPATDPAVTETTTGATDPTVTATTTDVTDPAQTIPTPPGSVDPIITAQTASETVTDPLIRALYFGTPDQPGFFNQLQQAGANLIGSDVPLQQTAGLTPLELLARQQAVAGLGGFEPFFQQNKDLIDQAIGQSRRAEALRDPYFQRAEQQMLLGLGDQLGGIDQARGITLGATDRFGRSLGRLGRQQIGATGAFGQRMGDIEAGAIGAADIFGRDLDATQAGLTGQVDEFGRRLGSVEGIQAGATDQFGRRLSDVEARGEGAAGRFGQALGGIEAGAIGSTDIFGRRLGESEDLLRRTLGGYDQGLTQQFYNPFEDRVVQQTIADITESAAKQDVAQRAQDIGRGGLSAFGSRGRLSASERQEALGKGLGEALAGIRAGGFSEAQRTGLSEFARQRAAERAASQGLSGLAGTRFGAESGLFDRLTSGAQQRLAAEQGVVDLLGRTGQQQLGAQQALANALQGTAGQRFGAGQTLAEFQRGTAGQQLASQQALQNLLQSSAGQQLGAQQQLGGLLRGLTGDQFSAQQQLAANLMGYGSAGAGARQNLASGLLGIGQQRGAGAQQLGQSLAGFGQQIGNIGSQLEALRRGQRGELAGFGGIGRGIAETGLSRLFAQQMLQQQRPLDALSRIGQLLPGYTQATSKIGTTYGMPSDPSALGLGAALGAYSSLAPQTGAAFANYGQTTGQG